MKLGVVSAASLVVLAASASASADDLKAVEQRNHKFLAQAGTEEGQRVFDILAQPLGSALNAFGRQAGLQVTVDTSLTTGVQAQAVSGTMTPAEALNQLLAGTGIVGRFTANRTVVLTTPSSGDTSGAVQLDPVRVQASVPPPQAEIGNLPPPYAGGQVAKGSRIGVLGNRDYMDTPYSVTTYTNQTIQDQQARTLVEAVRVDPTVRSFWGSPLISDQLWIRGFLVSPRDMSFNGMYNVGPEYTIGMAGVEQVEVFRGPTAMLNGMAPLSGVGGVINIVPKRAPDAGINQATLRYMNAGNFGGQLDVGHRFGPDKSLGLRANLAFSGGPTPIYANAESLLEAILGADFRGDRTRLDFDIGYVKKRINSPQYGVSVAPGVQIPAPPSNYSNINQPWEEWNNDDVYGMLRLEHDFAPGLTGFIRVGGRRTNIYSQTPFDTLTNYQGNFTATNFALNGFQETKAADFGVRGRFETGFVRHEMAVTASYGLRDAGFRTVLINLGTSNIYNPIYFPSSFANYNVPPAALTSQILLTSAGVIDAMSAFDDRVQVIAGVRGQRVATSNYSPVTGTTTPATPGSDTTATTPTVGFVLKPWKEVSFYGNYIQALEQGPVAGAGTLNAGQAFPAFVSQQFEVGAKFDFGNFGATLSAFQIARPNSFTAAGVFTVDGQQRNRGLEFVMFGEPLPGVRPLGGFTLLDPIQTGTLNGTNNGKYAPGVATFVANVGVDWQTPFLKGLEVGGRVIYTGPTYVDAANLSLVAASTRVDLSAKYVFERSDGKPIALRANVLNVGDTNYWVAAAGQLNRGLPRTFLLSLTADF